MGSANYEYEDIVLSPEEEQEAIEKAKREKLGKLRLEAWRKKIDTPLEEIKFNFVQMNAFVLRKAKDLIPEGLRLTKAEEEFYTTLCLYFSNDGEFANKGDGYSLLKGILISGGVGRGKTTTMKLFAGNTKQSFFVKSCSDIAREYASDGVGVINKYSEMQENRNKAYTFNQPSLGICFDDLGTEQDKNNFGNKANVMEEILLAIYDKQFVSGYKFHVTTNLTADQIGERYGNRLRSRLREMFNVIEYPTGPDRRK